MPAHMVMAYASGYQDRRQMESSIVISLHSRTAASSSALYGLHAKCKRVELPRVNHKRLSGRIGALDRVCGDLSRAMPECGQNLGLLPTLRRELGANNPNGQASAPRDRLGTKIVRDGSIDDIGAIGTGNVACNRGVGNGTVWKNRWHWANRFSHEVESRYEVFNDPAISEYVNPAGQNIVRNSDAHVPFTIRVIDSDDVNAFAFKPRCRPLGSGYALIADGPVIFGLEPNRRCRRRANPPICRIGLRNIALRTLITVLPE